MADHTADGLSHGARASLFGLLVNCAMVAGKLTAGIVGHSYALVADAVESSLDIFGSFVVWRGLRIAARPADADHPYGHGRAEALAGIVVAAMLFLAGVGIAFGAIREMRAPHPVPAPFTLIVLVGVVVLKEVMFRYVQRVAHETGSGAVSADAWHHRSDAITSLAAALGITVALVGGERWAHADELAALLAAGIIIFNAWLLGRQPLSELMDKHPVELVENARRVARDVAGVAAVEKTRARKIGLQYFVDMHIEVDEHMTVRDAHALAHRVKDEIRAALPVVQDVLVHVEPFNPPAA
jgi:cation diffusion facilitator family transporter